MIRGTTTLIAHIGYPTYAFKAPMIYNPYFESIGVDAVVMPIGIKTENFAAALRAIFTFTNIRGALITMPHKVTSCTLVDELSPTAQIAGACNAILLRPDGSLLGDMFDGVGFVRGVLRKCVKLEGARVLVVGCGGVGCAIAASLAAVDVAEIGLFDINAASADGLASRLCTHYAALKVTTGSNNPTGYDVVVNATPMGMNDGDELPIDVSRIAPTTFVGEVVMKKEMTAFLAAVKARGCPVQIGTDMLFEQIPAYLEFFGFPTTTPEALRLLARLTD